MQAGCAIPYSVCRHYCKSLCVQDLSNLYVNYLGNIMGTGDTLGTGQTHVVDME